MLSNREKRRKKNAISIHHVAVKLAAKHGLDKVTTEMISEEAGISLRTFFNYFPYKEAAFVPPELSFTQKAIDTFSNSDDDLLEDIVKLISPLFEDIQVDQQFLKNSNDLAAENPALMALRMHFIKEFETKIYNVIIMRFNQEESGKARHIAALISVSIRMGFETWIEDNQDALPNVISAKIFNLKTLFN